MSHTLAMVIGEGKPYEKTQCRMCFSEEATRSHSDHNNAYLYICNVCHSKYELSLDMLEKHANIAEDLSKFLKLVLSEPAPEGMHYAFWISSEGQVEYDTYDR